MARELNKSDRYLKLELYINKRGVFLRYFGSDLAFQ